MKVVRYYRFGPPSVLNIEEAEVPKISNRQILVKVHATTINSGDCHLRSGTPLMARVFAGPIVPRQKILGTTYSGIVSEVGAEVKNFKVGDEVMGSLGIKSGTYSQYISVEDDSVIIKKPSDLSHEECASIIFGSLSAKYFLDKVNIGQGKKVLIIGAAGSVGSFSVQYAKSFGAEVVGVCSLDSMDFAYELGLDDAIDYKSVALEGLNMKFDIILDTVGKESVSTLRSLLNNSGLYITTVARVDLLLKGALNKAFRSQFLFDIVKSNAESLIEITDLISKGIYRPLVDRVFNMESVIEAHQYFETARKSGAVVLKIID